MPTVAQPRRVDLGLSFGTEAAQPRRRISSGRPSRSKFAKRVTPDSGWFTSATGPWGTLQWTYDATGNRTKEVRDATTLYSYDATTHRLLSISGAASDTFTYDAFGRVTQDARGTYTYTPTDALASVTAPGLTATYLTGADQLRFRRSVNGRDQITVRGLSGEVLSEFEDECGARTWRRDLVYGAGVLIGAVKNAAPTPTVQFSAATSTVGEGAGTSAPAVVLGTATPLACPVTVTWQSASGSAIAAQDFTGAGGVLTFPAGSPNVAVLTTPVGLVDDAVYEGAESFSLALATPIGAVLGPQSSHSVTITDNDPMPQVSVSDVSVSERDGLATFTVSASPLSAAPITVPFTVWRRSGA